jgi:hypothetical protein
MLIYARAKRISTWKLKVKFMHGTCQAFCSAVQARLPSEIRSMVYAVLVPPQKIPVDRGNLSLHTLPHWLHQHLYDEGWWDLHPHYWDRSYTGDATCIELQERFFRSTVLLFDGDLEEVAMFHTMSEYHQRVGYIPKHSLTHLEMTF